MTTDLVMPRMMHFPSLEIKSDKIKIVKLDGEKLAQDFHKYCAKVFGFPSFYGNNMNAWIDCIDDGIDNENHEMVTKNYVLPGQSIVFYIENYSALKKSKEILEDLTECVSFINKRRILRRHVHVPIIYLVFDE